MCSWFFLYIDFEFSIDKLFNIPFWFNSNGVLKCTDFYCIQTTLPLFILKLDSSFFSVFYLVSSKLSLYCILYLSMVIILSSISSSCSIIFSASYWLNWKLSIWKNHIVIHWASSSSGVHTFSSWSSKLGRIIYVL